MLREAASAIVEVATDLDVITWTVSLDEHPISLRSVAIPRADASSL
jgi:hypothetical protein